MPEKQNINNFIETNILPLQFTEYYDFITSNSPNLEKSESLGILDIQNIYNQQNTNWKWVRENIIL
jgi:hypothetical protein